MGDKRVGLIIAGLDPSGGAGILLDTRVFSRFGLHACGVITANTVQNSCGAKEWQPTDENLFSRQLEALKEDLPVRVVKVGMLAKGVFLKKALETFKGVPFVVDPVAASKNGTPLVDNIEIYNRFAGEIFLITPNLVEAKALADTSEGDPLKLLHLLRKRGFKNILLKGGHSEDPKEVVDYLLTEEGELLTYRRDRLKVHPRGTGCLLSSAISANLLRYGDLTQAFIKAEEFIDEAFLTAKKIGKCYEIFAV